MDEAIKFQDIIYFKSKLRGISVLFLRRRSYEKKINFFFSSEKSIYNFKLKPNCTTILIGSNYFNSVRDIDWSGLSNEKIVDVLLMYSDEGIENIKSIVNLC